MLNIRRYSSMIDSLANSSVDGEVIPFAENIYILDQYSQ